MDQNMTGLSEMMTINKAIVGRLIDFIPESWTAAELRLGFNTTTTGAEMQVVNPDSDEGWTISDDLAESVLQLDQHRREHGLSWKAMIITVRQDESENWQVSVQLK